MGIDVELWRARIGTFNGGKGSRKLRALLAFRRLFLRDPVAWATGETTNCTPVAVHASIACLSLWLILRFLGSCWNKIKSTHPTKFNGGLSYHWSKDPKAPVSITLSIAVVVAIAVLLHSLTILLLRAGDVELNPGPIMNTPLTLADLHQVHTKLYEARTVWFNIGLCLSVDHETLCSIRRKFANDDDDCLREMIAKRLKSSDRLTWARLCDCLREQIVARVDLANKIEKELKGEASQGGTFNAATSTFPIQDPLESEDYLSVSEQEDLCSPLDVSIKDTFPCLDVTSLDKSEERNLYFRLWRQSKELHREFSRLCTNTYRSLKDHDVSKDELVVCITGDDSLESFVKGQNKSILADRKQELFEAKDISKVWEIASDYFSYFNYYLIQQIIEHFGTKKDKEKLAEYKKSFTEYARRSFRQSPAEYGSQNETDSVIIVKLGAPKYEDCTLGQLEQFIDEFSEILKLTQDGVLRLCRVLPGCVELTLLAPSFVESDAFPLSPDQEAALKALGVIRLRCGDYTYPSEEEDDHSDKGSDSDPDDAPSDSGRGTFTGTGTSKSRTSEYTTSSEVLGLAGPDEYQSTESKVLEHISATHSAAKHGDSNTFLVSLSNLEENYDDHFAMEFDTEHNSPLHVAAYKGDLTAVKRCIEVEGCDPLQVNERGVTVLYAATQARRLNVIKYLVEDRGLSAAIVTESAVGFTPLNMAIFRNDLSLVKYFVGIGQVDPLCIDGHKVTPLHHACNSGNLKIVEYLIDEARKVEPIESVVNIVSPIDGNSLLHCAALSGNLDIVKLLAESYNLNPNACNKHGVTPFHSAVFSGQLNVVQYLTDVWGCDASIVAMPFNENALHTAASRGHTDIVKFLTIDKKCDPTIKNSSGSTVLHVAAGNGFLKIVEFLLEKFEGLGDLVDNNNRNPLHYAVQSGKLDVVKLLIKHNPASAVSRDKGGEIPLHQAVKDINTILSDHSINPEALNNSGLASVCVTTENDQLAIIEFLTLEKQCDPLCKNNQGITPFHLAALYCRLKILQFFVNQLHCDPNTPDNYGAMPIHFACQGGQTEVVRCLLESCQCDKSAVDEDGNTPLHCAVSYGKQNIVEFLTLEKQCDPLCKNNQGNTPFHLAALDGHLETLQFFVNQLHCDPNIPNNDGLGAMPIHLACQRGHTAIIRYLLNSCHCDKSALDKDGWTPLHFAASYGKLDTVKFLTLEKKCDSLCKNKQGSTPLQLAHAKGHIDVAQFLLNECECDKSALDTGKNSFQVLVQQILKLCIRQLSINKDGITLCHLSALDGNLEKLELIVNKLNCDPNTPDNHGVMPIHLACEGGHIDVARYLLDSCQCDKSALDKYGQTPLHYAAIQGKRNIVEFLILEKQCDPFCKNNKGNTPFHLAALYGHLEALQFFLKQLHCDPNTPNNVGAMPIHLACGGGQTDVVRFLLNNCTCDKSAVDKDGHTLLHYAAKRGHSDIIAFLIFDEGCDWKCEDNDSNTPLHIAAENGHLSTVKLFVEILNEDPNATNKKGVAPLHLACANGHIDVVRYLIDDCKCDKSAATMDNLEWTPLHYAASTGKLNIVKFLTSEKKCDSLCKDKQVSTPLQLARANGHIDVAQFLLTECYGDKLGEK